MHAVSLLLAWGGGLMKENSYGGNALSITGTAARINTEVLALELIVRSNASQSYNLGHIISESARPIRASTYLRKAL